MLCLRSKAELRKLTHLSSCWCEKVQDFKNTLCCACVYTEDLRWWNVAGHSYARMRMRNLRQEE